MEITGIESDVSGLTFEPSVFTLEPDSSQTRLHFRVQQRGLINILSNDPDRAKHTVSVSVIVQPPPAPALAVQQTAIDFGTVAFAQPVQADDYDSRIRVLHRWRLQVSRVMYRD